MCLREFSLFKSKRFLSHSGTLLTSKLYSLAIIIIPSTFCLTASSRNVKGLSKYPIINQKACETLSHWTYYRAGGDKASNREQENVLFCPEKRAPIYPLPRGEEAASSSMSAFCSLCSSIASNKCDLSWAWHQGLGRLLWASCRLWASEQHPRRSCQLLGTQSRRRCLGMGHSHGRARLYESSTGSSSHMRPARQ